MLLQATCALFRSDRCIVWRSAPTTRQSVLIVEHRDEVFARIAEDLRSQGVNVDRASTPKEACAKFATDPSDLIVANRELSHEESGWLLVSKWAIARRRRRIWLYTAFPTPFDEHWRQFTRVEKVLYHEGDLWKLSDLLRSEMRLSAALKAAAFARPA